MAGNGSLTVDVVSPTGVLWSGEASSVVVPAAEGELGVLPGREPVLAVLLPGTARVTSDGSTVSLDVHGGFVSVDDDVVTVVVADEDAEVGVLDAEPASDDSTLA
ncbi:F0F1 ATP synthase subunit epsilon [Georgenia sp. Z1491]|uniref:F0F1 ATP synthase subunit epsilon n=1 Tax=Georgenia sp. Z1491 TaxID=3416707 RepID=UPI003CEDAA6C